MLRFNRAHLGQVFNHLCWNAREALQDRGTLSISSQRCIPSEGSAYALTGGEFLHLAFRGNGPGIDPGLMPRICTCGGTKAWIGDGHHPWCGLDIGQGGDGRRNEH